ncbi:MAG: peptidoglycan DD-metalloendopeptidase family protein [Chitinophagales bacterium]|nr:peptidoglycan DD-metalloendopeptidase family protein [Chitinophagales bacterium]
MMRKKILLPLFVVGFAMAGLAQPVQDKVQLEKERQEIQRELQEMQGLYNKLKGQTKKSVGQLNVLVRQINLQEQYISNINRELRNIDDDIYLSELEIYRLNKQLDTLKSQYAKSIVYSYKNRSNYDYVNFIFSAGSFNDAVKRVAYLKSYRAYREKQVSTIQETQQLIAQRKQQQLIRKDQKNVALQSQTKQVQQLAVQKKEKDEVVRELKTKEKDLQKQIADKRSRDAKLKNAIFAIIERERIKAIEEEKKRLAAIKDAERKTTPVTDPKTKPAEPRPGTITDSRPKAAPAEKTYVPLNANETALAASFKQNYGRLPWPVDNGVVCSNFGTNKIEGTLLTEDNPGITICTSAGAVVKSIFDGEVLSVFNLGDGMAVMIKHGNYYTIYSNLSSTSIAKGATVKARQAIGKAGSDENGGGKIDLLLMLDKKNVNPRPWLSR